MKKIYIAGCGGMLGEAFYTQFKSEKGIVPTINEILFKDNSAMGVLGMLTKGSAAVLGKDAIKMMHYEFINQQNIQSVVFGASTKKHIEETVSLIKV